jgi:hypothetical protein
MFEIAIALLYWALFAGAVLGALGSVYFTLSGRWFCVLVCLGAMVPYGGMWLVDYGSNCLIRKEIPVAAEVVSTISNELSDGRNVVVRLTPQQRTFCDEPSMFEFSNFGAIDDRPVAVVGVQTKRGIDGLVTTVDVDLFVPSLGSAAVRLDAITFGKRRYVAKSEPLPLEIHYAHD